MPSSDLGIIIVIALMLYLIPLVAAIWVYYDATKRPRNAISWAVAAFLVGPLFAVVVLVYVITRDFVGRPQPPTD